MPISVKTAAEIKRPMTLAGDEDDKKMALSLTEHKGGERSVREQDKNAVQAQNVQVNVEQHRWPTAFASIFRVRFVCRIAYIARVIVAGLGSVGRFAVLRFGRHPRGGKSRLQ
jgi:hypothetical protein